MFALFLRGCPLLVAYGVMRAQAAHGTSRSSALCLCLLRRAVVRCLVPGPFILLDVRAQDLTALNTLGLRARASALVVYTGQAQLPALSALAQQHGQVFVLGGGSNVVLGPVIDGLVIKVASRGIRLLEARDDCWIVEAQGGVVWHDFVAHCLENGWAGLENLALIPGTVGAAPVQNIGAYGVEFDQRFHSLDAWDLKHARMVTMSARDCGFSYRHSVFKEGEPGRWLITAVRFRLPRPWRPVLDYPDLQRHTSVAEAGQGIGPRDIFDAVCDIRRRKLPDPAVLGNAGSFFKNPIVNNAAADALQQRYPDLVRYPQADGQHSKLAAGWMIDRAGWKGRRVGPVGTHDRQALVLVNHGGATAADVARLADAIRADVQRMFGVNLEQEPVAVPASAPAHRQ